MITPIRKRIFSYLLPYKWKFMPALLLIFMISGTELLKPWPFKVVIDSVIGQKALPWGLRLSPMSALLVSCGAIVLIYILSAMLTLALSYIQVDLGRRIVSDLRGDLYSHLQRLSLRFHNSWPEGDLLYRVTSDTTSLQTVYTAGLLPLTSALLLVVGMFVVLIRLDSLLTLVALGIGPLLFLLLSPLGRKLTDAASHMRVAESNVLTSVQRSISSMHVIQAFTREPDELSQFLQASHASLKAGVRFYLLQSLYGAVSNITIGVWIALLIGLGAYQVSVGRITVGTLVVFSTYLAVLLFSLHQASQAFASLKAAIASVKRVFGILDEQIDIPDGHHMLSYENARADINLTDVTFGYSPDTPILKRITLRIKAGQRVAIVGPTGSGKSTLVSLIARFYDPSDGFIAFGSQDLRELQIQSLRQNISMVLQPPLLFPMTIADNIRYGNPSASDDHVAEAAKLAMIDGFIASLPEGYQTMIGERGVNLSEGQKQRITIARALLRDVPIVILDEPTSAMDAETEFQVMAGLNRLLKNKTSLIIAHRLSTIRSADLIVVLSHGRIVEQGSFQELVALNGFFADLCRHQFDNLQLSTPL